MSPQDQKDKFETAFRELVQKAKVTDWDGQFYWNDTTFGKAPSTCKLDHVVKQFPEKLKGKFVALKNKLRSEGFK